MQRLWDVLAGLLTARQARMLKALLEVPVGTRRSDLERLRKGITTVSGKGMVAALDRVAEVAGLGPGAVALDGVPQRRIVELARGVRARYAVPGERFIDRETMGDMLFYTEDLEQLSSSEQRAAHALYTGDTDRWPDPIEWEIEATFGGLIDRVHEFGDLGCHADAPELDEPGHPWPSIT